MRKVLFHCCLFLFILSACDNQQEETNYYLSLMGESESWKLTGYEIVLSAKEVKVGNGKLVMKHEGEYNTDFFSFNTYVVTNGEEDRIHAGSVSGKIDISEQSTGSIESDDGYAIKFEDVGEIYMTVEWWNPNENEHRKERIDLYQKHNDETFLN